MGPTVHQEEGHNSLIINRFNIQTISIQMFGKGDFFKNIISLLYSILYYNYNVYNIL